MKSSDLLQAALFKSAEPAFALTSDMRKEVNAMLRANPELARQLQSSLTPGFLGQIKRQVTSPYGQYEARMAARRSANPVRINPATGLPMNYRAGDSLPADAPDWAVQEAQRHTDAVYSTPRVQRQPSGQGGMPPMIVEDRRMPGEDARNAYHTAVRNYHSAPTEKTPEAIAAGVSQRSQELERAMNESTRQLGVVNEKLDTSNMRSLRIHNPRAAALQAARIKSQYGYAPDTDTFKARYELDPATQDANRVAFAPKAKPVGARPQSGGQVYRQPMSFGSQPQPASRPHFARGRR